MQTILEIEGLSKRYKDFSLENVSFSLPAGCIMGFIGENGAGKSTTIKLILGLIQKDAGNVRMFGRENYLENKDVFEQIGVVLDETGLHDTLTARDCGAIFSRMYRTWKPQVFLDYCARFSLPEKKQLKEFSSGMKRKLSIAAALSHDSRLLLLDEATSGLDPIVRDELLDVFLEFIQDERRSILLSSHILSDLEKACDYISFLHKGRLLFCEQKDVLLERYCVLKCAEGDLGRIDPARIHGIRRNKFGVEALVERENIPKGFLTNVAGIEDIMLFLSRGEKQ